MGAFVTVLDDPSVNDDGRLGRGFLQQNDVIEAFSLTMILHTNVKLKIFNFTGPADKGRQAGASPQTQQSKQNMDDCGMFFTIN